MPRAKENIKPLVLIRPQMYCFIERDSFLWGYMSSEQKGLVDDGEMLFSKAHELPHSVSDFSYLVFPFAKAYEGFLKKMFLDTNLSRSEDYYGDDIRIGRILNPRFQKEYGSVYSRICRGDSSDEGVSVKLWKTWKKGRNLVFHYFPHNFRKLTFDEAREIVQEIVDSMEFAVNSCRIGEYVKTREKITQLS